MEAHLFRRRLSGRFPPSNPTPPGDPAFPLSQGALLPRLPPQRGSICLEYHRCPLRSPSGVSEVEARAQDQHSHPAFTLPLANMLNLPFRKYNHPRTASKAPYRIGAHSTCRGRRLNNGCAPQLSFSPSWPLGFLARTTTAPAYRCLFFTAQLFSFYLKRP